MSPGFFPRQMRLIVTDDDGVGVDLGRLSTKFEISMSSEGSLGRAKVVVFNLSEDTISRISSQFTRIEIQAGYPQRMGTIFKGEVRNVFATREGPDKLVEIFAGDGALDYGTTTVSAKFSEGTSVREVVRAISSQSRTTGLAVGSLDFITDDTIDDDLTVDGMLRDELTKLGRSYGFRWWIQAGVFQFVDSSRAFKTPSIEISRDTGMIDSPVATPSGVEVLSLLNHNIIPGRRVNIVTAGALVSASDSSLQFGERGGVDDLVRGRKGGEFDVLRVLHIGETRGQTWYTKAFCQTPVTA